MVRGIGLAQRCLASLHLSARDRLDAVLDTGKAKLRILEVDEAQHFNSFAH
jgi:hypothetical protein